MLATYASVVVVLGAAVAVGQSVFALAGRRRMAPLAPAAGLAVLCAVAWATVRLPGREATGAVALALLTLGSLALLRGRVEQLGAAARVWAPVAIAALAAASLPFAFEGQFGVLGTGLNPDMSQHLFATDRLAAGGSERLIEQGYPLGPHALVVALGALGIEPVSAFNGLMIATATAAALAALALTGRAPAVPRVVGALLIGFTYLVAAYHVQGSFKETLQALFLLGFALALADLARAPNPRAREALPLAALAVGSAYVYSFPGLAWLAGALGIWVVVELGLAWRRGGSSEAAARVRAAAPPAALAAAVALAALAPEIGRMVAFSNFETFDPPGPGLGNLFNRLSPLEALGIWPSGDFRLEPGDGAAPAIVFWAGSALAAVALALGLRHHRRAGDLVLPAALAAAAVLWLYALVFGTPYQESKTLVLAAPLAAAIAVAGLLPRPRALLTLAFALAAGGSSLLVLINGPVGPAGYSPALSELRERLGSGSTLVVASPELLADRHGRDYLVWELRGNRICVEPEGSVAASAPAAGIARVVRVGGQPLEPLEVTERPQARGPGPCPLIPDGARADPAGDG